MSADNKYGTLLADFNLRGMLEQQRSSIKVAVDALDQNRILNTAQEDLIKFYVDKNFVEAPVLRRDEWAADSHEATAVVEDFRRKITVPVTRIEVEVPFDGESTLFKGQPTQFTFSPPNARIKSNSILLTFEIRSGSNENVREKVDRELNEIEKYLEWLHSDVTAHNGALRQVAETAVNSRRTRILGNQGVLASLGIPLKERPDAPKTFASPEVRRKIVPFCL